MWLFSLLPYIYLPLLQGKGGTTSYYAKYESLIRALRLICMESQVGQSLFLKHVLCEGGGEGGKGQAQNNLGKCEWDLCICLCLEASVHNI